MDFLRLEDEFSRDDNTSYTSSIATTNSAGVTEDGDDLHLGAEANSFGKATAREVGLPSSPTSPTNQIAKSRKGKYCDDSLIIMKHVYCSVENTETDVAYSSISSIMDIINARECDADEMLTSLGFANCSNEMTKRDILTRFNASPLLNNEDNRYLDVMCNGHVNHHNEIRPRYKNSINKAQEWLAVHHNQDITREKNDFNKSLSISGSGAKKSSVSRSNKWKRFPKSRQSSFELLLPNLEEEMNVEVNATSKKSSSPAHPPIRESSLEITHTVDDEPTTHTQVSPLHPLPIINTDETGEESGILQLTQDDASRADIAKTTDEEDRKLSRLLKTSLLVANQRDSFELEEINSCNGETTDCNRLRRSGCTFLTIDSNKHNGACLSPNSEGASENESSSGFGEDEVVNLTNHMSTSDLRHHVSPHTVVESIQAQNVFPAPLHSSSMTTHYVYDVELGGDPKKIETRSSVCVNPTDNAHGADIDNRRLEKNRFRSKSSSALLSNYVPLRSSNSWHNFGKIPEGYVVTPISNAGDSGPTKDMHVMRNSRSFFSDARRRRKEFAERSALSGDSITELVSSSLVRHNGSYVIKKRRPGHFRYSTSCDDFFVKQNNSADDGIVLRNAAEHPKTLKSMSTDTTLEGNNSVKTNHDSSQLSTCSHFPHANISSYVNPLTRELHFAQGTNSYAVKHGNGS